MVVRPPKITRTRIPPATQARKEQCSTVNFGVINCLILTKTATKWSKNYQDAMKRPKFYCTVRVQPNQKCVPRLISLFAGLVPQRGAREPETTFLVAMFRKVSSVNRMCGAINWNDRESKASSCLKGYKK